jgi:hypothetical protein
MKKILFSIVICFLSSGICAQEIGEIKEVKLTLMDIPISGDAIQPNFLNDVTSEIISFNHMDWLDKHVSLYDFFHKYKDSCSEIAYAFIVTMIYIPMEQFKHGEILNQWVLTSIIRSETEQEDLIVYNENSFNDVISTVEGDLNKDGIIDLSIVKQDTLHENAPYKLEIFFGRENGDFKLIVSTTKAIQPQFPNGREHHMWGNGFGELSIHNGVLWIETGFIRGHMEHKFRYQNNSFELIGYSYVNADFGTIKIVDYNLSTGKRIEKEGAIGSDEYTVTLDKVIKLNPLPKLDEFEQYANDLY